MSWFAPETGTDTDAKVYIRDAEYAWLPATVVQTSSDGDSNNTNEDDNENNKQDNTRVQVRIDLPSDWESTTVCHHNQTKQSKSSETTTTTCSMSMPHGQTRWVSLCDYPKHQLLLQNQGILARDMAELPHLHEAAILYQVKERHVREKPYTRVGEIVVAINPCQWIEGLYSKEEQEKYAKILVWQEDILGGSEGKKDDSTTDASSTAFASSFDKLGYEPHIYEVSALAYRGLARDRKDQVILVSGESGAGKTETVKIVLQHLATLEQSAPKKKTSQDAAALGDLVRRAVGSSTIFEAFGGAKAKITPEQSAPKRESNRDSAAFGKLVRRVVVSAPLFEAFGNAKTLNNHNSSRFGKVTRLQFAIQPDNICSLQGSTYETCLLETSRVVAQGAGERSFHIFYQLLAAPRDVKISLLGTGWAEATAADFAFLSQSGDGCKVGVSDADSWERTMHALKFFEWKDNSLQALVQALGIVLRLGNLTFKDTEDGVAITSLTALEQVAYSMGIAPNTVEHALTHRIIKMSQDQVAVPLNAESAKDACDALVKRIYEIIFDAVVESVNTQTNAPNDSEEHGTVSLVDIFGFECFEVNRFEQLCVNYVNEKIQHRYVEDNLRRCKAEYKKEGIELLDYKLIDNTLVLDLLEGRSGIISSLNEESVRPNGSNEAFVSKIKKAHEFNSGLISEKLHARTQFGVQHFAGPVTYEADMFMERNKDKLQHGLLSLAAMTSNTLIAGEFNSLLEEHAVNETAGVIKKKATSMTFLEKFRIQLRDLMATMEGSQTRYIRCIKPNNTMVPKVIDQSVVFKQLQCAGLVTAIEIARGIFPNNLPYAKAEERFACLMEPGHLQATRDMELQDKVYLMTSSLFAPLIERFGDSDFFMPFACGKTKVFFRSGALENLESLRHDWFSKRAIMLQRWNRKLRNEHRYIRFRKAVIQMQAFQRSHLTRSLCRKRKQGATSIQSWVRLLSARSRYQQSKKAATVLAAWSRSWIFPLRFRSMKRAATKIETWGRSRVASTRFNLMKSAILSLQAHVRGHPERARFQKMREATVVVQTLARVQLAKKAVILYRQEAALEFTNKNACVIQGWWWLVSRRQARHLRERESLKSAAVQIWWQERQSAAAAVIQSWSRVRVDRIRFQQMKKAAAAAVIIQSWSRTRLERIHFQQKEKASSLVQAQRVEEGYKKKSSSFIQAWYRGIIAQRIDDCKKRANDVKALSDIKEEWSSSPEESRIVSTNHEYTVAQELTKEAWGSSLEESQIVSTNHEYSVAQELTTLSIYRQEYATRKASRGSRLTEEEIATLREEVQQVTTEAEMHLQEVQTDFEDKLVDYEDEVLQLNQTIRQIQQEKRTLQEEVTTAQQNYVTNIQRLKKGMHKSHDSHKEYLSKVMGMLEEANAARKGETERITRELESVKLEKDAKVSELEEELDLLRKLGLPAQLSEVEDDDASSPGDEEATAKGEADKKTRRTIQKLEKVVSPANILEVVCAAQRQPGCTVPYIDQKISSRCRTLIGRLENQAPRKKDVKDAETQVDLVQEKPDLAKDETIDQLQQQLVWAYEEVESLQMQLGDSAENAQCRQRKALIGRKEGNTFSEAIPVETDDSSTPEEMAVN